MSRSSSSQAALFHITLLAGCHPTPPAGSSVAVRGGSVHGGSTSALAAIDGGKAVAEGAVLEAWPAMGQVVPSSAAAACGPGSALVVRHCELRLPKGRAGTHVSLNIEGGARATAADCACSGFVLVQQQGSSLPGRPGGSHPHSHGRRGPRAAGGACQGGRVQGRVVSTPGRPAACWQPRGGAMGQARQPGHWPLAAGSGSGTGGSGSSSGVRADPTRRGGLWLGRRGGCGCGRRARRLQRPKRSPRVDAEGRAGPQQGAMGEAAAAAVGWGAAAA